MKLDEYPCDQIMAELIIRLQKTNGIEFCSEEQIGELLDLLIEAEGG